MVTRERRDRKLSTLRKNLARDQRRTSTASVEWRARCLPQALISICRPVVMKRRWPRPVIPRVRMPMGLSEEMVQLHCSFSLTLSNIIASLTVLSLCASPYHQYHDGSHPTETFSSRWTRTVNRIHKPYLKHVLHPLTQRSARNRAALPQISMWRRTEICCGRPLEYGL